MTDEQIRAALKLIGANATSPFILHNIWAAVTTAICPSDIFPGEYDPGAKECYLQKCKQCWDAAVDRNSKKAP